MSGIKQQKPAFLCSVWLVICFSFAIQTLSFADTFHENSVDPLEWLEDEETRREMEETDHHNFFSEGYVPIGVHFGGHFLSGGAIKSFLGSSSAHTEADTKEDPEYKGLGNSHVSLCRVNHTLHWDNPPKFAMFRQLVQASCRNRHDVKVVRLSLLMQVMDKLRQEEGHDAAGLPNTKFPPLKPQGFVFHEARCGSTTVANMLASVREYAVYSESNPPVDVLLRSPSWMSHELKLKVMQNVVAAMTRVPGRKATFFKMQSVTSDHIGFIREAFPDTPWAFVYRNPAEGIASQLRNVLKSSGFGLQRAGGAPCLRQQHRSVDRPYVDQLLADKIGPLDDPKSGSSSTTAPSVGNTYCVAHVASLRHHALQELQKQDGKGTAINYATIPDIVPEMITTHFGRSLTEQQKSRMFEISKMYSKSMRQSPVEFKSDTNHKIHMISSHKDLVDAIKKYLLPLQEKLNEYAEGASYISNTDIEKITANEKSNEIPASSSSTNNQGAPSDTTLLASGQRSLFLLSSSEEDVSHAKPPNPHPDLHKGGTLDGEDEEPPQSNVLPTDEYKQGLPEEGWVNPPPGAPGRRVRSNEDGTPPQGYPQMFPLTEILKKWNPDEPRIPSDYGQYASLKTFDYQTQYEEACIYRNMEVPFIIRNVPALNSVVEKWSDQYLQNKFGSTPKHVETNDQGNHFMYYNQRFANRMPGYKPPTESKFMTFPNWKEKADQIGQDILTGQRRNNESPHYYFRASAIQKKRSHLRPKNGERVLEEEQFLDEAMEQEGARHLGASLFNNNFISEDLTFFYGDNPSFFIVDPTKQRGIHCRFGMTGIVAESHYDAGRNFITMERGFKRYILSPPSECGNLDILRTGPSSRHSATDWSKIEEAQNKLKSARALEVIIQEGDMLYVPAYWFHYIQSLTTNIQCNSRSGNPYIGQKEIRECGFGLPQPEPIKETNYRIKKSIEDFVASKK